MALFDVKKFDTLDKAESYCKIEDEMGYTFNVVWGGPGTYIAKRMGIGSYTFYHKEVYLQQLNQELKSLQEEMEEVKNL